MRHKLFTLIIFLLAAISFSCREIRTINRQKATEEIDSLKKFEFLTSRTNIDYSIFVPDIESYKSDCKKSQTICKCIYKDLTEISKAFFVDNFYIATTPHLKPIIPVECNLDSCFALHQLNGCIFGLASLTGESKPVDLRNSKGLLHGLISCDKQSSKNYYYKAIIKFDFLMEFKNIDKRGPICEVQLQTRFYLKSIDRGDLTAGYWYETNESDKITASFERGYKELIKSSFTEKLKILKFLHENK